MNRAHAVDFYRRTGRGCLPCAPAIQRREHPAASEYQKAIISQLDYSNFFRPIERGTSPGRAIISGPYQNSMRASSPHCFVGTETDIFKIVRGTSLLGEPISSSVSRCHDRAVFSHHPDVFWIENMNAIEP